MFYYRLYDFLIASNFAFHELTQVEEEYNQSYTFNLSTEKARHDLKEGWLSDDSLREINDGLIFVRKENGYLFRFDKMADFEVSFDGEIITAYLCEGIPEATICYLFLNQVIPLVISGITGRLVLHAGCIDVKGEAIIFLGLSGRGKSTITFDFCRSGLPLLSDDCLLIEYADGKICALPSYPTLRLWDDSVKAFYTADDEFPDVAHYTVKKRLEVKDKGLKFCEKPIPVGQVYFLTEPDDERDEIKIEPVAKTKAFVELMHCMFRFDPDDRKIHKREFENLGPFVETASFYRLSYPREFDLLPLVREKVLDNFKKEKETYKKNV